MCEMTEGYVKVCDSVGGVETIYGCNTKDIATATVLAGEVTALTMKPGKYIYAFEVEMETANFEDADIGERANGASASQQTGTMVLHGNTKEQIVQYGNMRRGRTTWFPALNDGSMEAFFLRNGAKSAKVRSTGTAFEDLNGSTVTLSGKEVDIAPKISASLIAANLAPTS